MSQGEFVLVSKILNVGRRNKKMEALVKFMGSAVTLQKNDTSNIHVTRCE
jgi:hypothetical protein